MTKEELIQHLNLLFYYKGRGANNGEWHSYPTKSNYDSPWTDFTRPHSHKDYGHVIVRYYIDEYNKVEEYGHEIVIEMYLPSYCDTYTVFEGWIQTIEDLYSLLRMIGIPYKNRPVYKSLDSWVLKDKGIIYNVIYEGPEIDPRSLLEEEIILDGKLSKIRGVEHWALPEIKSGASLGILKYEY